jgi:glycosyltransferase involved in cell wall biosynthesis
MKIALVHDYLKEFGGAERVLKELSEMYPDAPIYTAFRVNGSTADKEFDGKDIRESWLAPILKMGKLYSPLRFLIPIIWGTMDLSKYDLVITSCSWYITRGFKIGKNTKVIAYCHTPPRWLYGYETSVGFKKWWFVRTYAAIVGHFLRMYDFAAAQEPKQISNFQFPIFKTHSGVDVFIANSKNVKARIEKFYRRGAEVIYPPVDIEKIIKVTSDKSKATSKKEEYFLIVSRLVGAKGLEEAVKAFKDLKYKLKIVGEKAGYSEVETRLRKLSGGNIVLLGRIDDISLYHHYAGATGFIALARDEDFGMTVVEAQAAGTPVIAFNGGGFRESVIDPSTGSGQVATGILIDDTSEETIKKAINKLAKKKWGKKVIQKNAERFSKENFIKQIKQIVNKYA